MRYKVKVGRPVLVMVLASLCLAGCVPFAKHYRRLEAAGGQYVDEAGCSLPAGKEILRFPYHGIYVSLSATDDVWMALHIPEGTTARLNDNAVLFEGRSASDQRVRHLLLLHAAQHGALGSAIPMTQFGMGPDPYVSPTHFGPLLGANDGKHLRWYLFTISPDPATRFSLVSGKYVDGSVQLPSMTINGTTFGPQKLPFKRALQTAAFLLPCAI